MAEEELCVLERAEAAPLVVPPSSAALHCVPTHAKGEAHEEVEKVVLLELLMLVVSLQLQHLLVQVGVDEECSPRLW